MFPGYWSHTFGGISIAPNPLGQRGALGFQGKGNLWPLHKRIEGPAKVKTGLVSGQREGLRLWLWGGPVWNCSHTQHPCHPRDPAQFSWQSINWVFKLHGLGSEPGHLQSSQTTHLEDDVQEAAKPFGLELWGGRSSSVPLPSIGWCDIYL